MAYMGYRQNLTLWNDGWYQMVTTLSFSLATIINTYKDYVNSRQISAACEQVLTSDAKIGNHIIRGNTGSNPISLQYKYYSTHNSIHYKI